MWGDWGKPGGRGRESFWISSKAVCDHTCLLQAQFPQCRSSSCESSAFTRLPLSVNRFITGECSYCGRLWSLRERGFLRSWDQYHERFLISWQRPWTRLLNSGLNPARCWALWLGSSKGLHCVLRLHLISSPTGFSVRVLHTLHKRSLGNQCTENTALMYLQQSMLLCRWLDVFSISCSIFEMRWAIMSLDLSCLTSFPTGFI